MNSEILVRRMTENEVGLIRSWANQEGWNPGVHDLAAFHAADPEGFFIGLLDEQPVACISCVRYGDGYGFLGQYIVHSDFRGRGYGVAVWKAGMAHLNGCNVGLDGVLAQVPNYERSGFRFSHYHVRYGGIGGGDAPADLVPLTDVPFERVAAYDAKCFPAKRDVFLRSWLSLSESVALGAMANGRLSGFGALRKAADGYKLGPLFSDDLETAMRLLAGLIATIPNQSYCVDVPEPDVQPGTTQLAQQFGLKEVFRTARMYTTGDPAFDRARVFGITTLELG